MSEERLARIEQKVDVLTDGMATLAVHVKQLDQRIGGLDTRMDGLDQRMDGLDQRMDRLDQKMDRLDQKMDAGFQHLEKRLDSFETTQIATNGELSDLVHDHERRIVRLERER